MTIDAEQTSGLIVIGGLVVVLAMQIRHGVWLREIARHDGVLFRFCEIRRRVVRLLFDRHLENGLLARDRRDGLRLLNLLNQVIGDYNKRKAVMFNFRRFIRALRVIHALREYAKTAGGLRMPRPPQDREIADLYGQMKTAFLRGFLAYTPLIRCELTFRIIEFFARKFLRRSLSVAVDRLRCDVKNLKLESANFGGDLIR